MLTEAPLPPGVVILPLTILSYFGHWAASIEHDLYEPGGSAWWRSRLEAQLQSYHLTMIAEFGWAVLVGMSSDHSANSRIRPESSDHECVVRHGIVVQT